MHSAFRLLGSALLCAAIGLSAALVPGRAAAQSDAAASPAPENFGDWMMVYYRAKQPDAVPEAVVRAIENRVFDMQHVSAFFGFVAGYLRENPDRVQATLAAAERLSESDRQFILVPAVLAAAPGSVEAASRRARLNKSGLALLTRADEAGIRPGDRVAPLSPYALDYMWGLFFATGDANAVAPMLPLLAAERDANDAMKTMIAEAAKWSLGANARQHKAIRDFCAAQALKQPPAVAAKLREIVAQADAG